MSKPDWGSVYDRKRKKLAEDLQSFVSRETGHLPSMVQCLQIVDAGKYRRSPKDQVRVIFLANRPAFKTKAIPPKETP